uniref:CCHC-type domain-containing protein n=1 Tax=Tanacetum cinerariifolium TaxID=118510 RepID=A0A6L2L835_TANCI|nr:hypothetical protein [Tanacetum cinerariifolium]
MQKEEDLRGDDLKHYEAEIKAMNLILISILIDIYNSVDACTTAEATWQRVERNASRAKKLEKTHDPLALVAHTGSSFRTTTPTCVTHPSLVVDYDDDYQGDIVQSNSDDPLTFAMIFLSCAITRNFSNPTNNHLRNSSNTRNQSIIQRDRVKIQSRTSGTAVTIQCYNCSEKGHYAHEQKYFPSCFISTEDPLNESSPYSSSETKPINKSIPSANPMSRMSSLLRRLGIVSVVWIFGFDQASISGLGDVDDLEGTECRYQGLCLGEPFSPDRGFDFSMDEPEPQYAYDFFALRLLPGYAGAEVDESLVDPLIDELTEPLVEVEEQMVALVIDMEEDLAMLFRVKDESSDDDFEGPEGDELVWEDLCTRMGNLEYGHGMLVKKVIMLNDAEVANNIAIMEIGPRVSTVDGSNAGHSISDGSGDERTRAS